MSVLLHTNIGDLLLSLSTSHPFSPNFFALCASKYYDSTLLFNRVEGRFVQGGDPTGTGKGGSSIEGLISGSEEKRFSQSALPAVPPPTGEELRKPGVLYPVSFIPNVKDTENSQFLITLGTGSEGGGIEGYFPASSLPVPFATVIRDEKGVLGKVNSLYSDADGRPYQDVSSELNDGKLGAKRRVIMPPRRFASSLVANSSQIPTGTNPGY